MNEQEFRECGNCGQKVPSANFALHSARCCRTRIRCSECNIAVEKNQMQNHRTAYHTPVKCICGLEFNNVSLQEHQRVCSKVIVSCENCGNQFKREDMAQHQTDCRKVSIPPTMDQERQSASITSDGSNSSISSLLDGLRRAISMGENVDPMMIMILEQIQTLHQQYHPDIATNLIELVTDVELPQEIKSSIIELVLKMGEAREEPSQTVPSGPMESNEPSNHAPTHESILESPADLSGINEQLRLHPFRQINYTDNAFSQLSFGNPPIFPTHAIENQVYAETIARKILFENAYEEVKRPPPKDSIVHQPHQVYKGTLGEDVIASPIRIIDSPSFSSATKTSHKSAESSSDRVRQSDSTEKQETPKQIMQELAPEEGILRTLQTKTTQQNPNTREQQHTRRCQFCQTEVLLDFVTQHEFNCQKQGSILETRQTEHLQEKYQRALRNLG
eukprot:TRINITY_DN4399_c0_g1_i1.p1 TRINITY_DN4399_c0_g1~~TRINITY_DN4399_c0_g1_i1.p1  ORF type:complete len:448 (+),score=86.52 TRINITY_DN4399_c0_g1_i1:72-1415(+)